MNVVLVAPTDYGISKHLVDALESKGLSVIFVREHFATWSGLLNRVLLRLPPVAFGRINLHWIRWKLKDHLHSCKIDVLIVVRARYLTRSVLQQLIADCQPTKCVMYQWDYLENLPLFPEQVDLFDQVFSFDRNDADQFNVIHKPLFYNKFHREYAGENAVNLYQVSFIGTLHSDRYNVVESIRASNPELFTQSFISFYMSRFTYFVKKLLRSPVVEMTKPSDISFTMVGELVSIQCLASSDFILDISQEKQTGLTIRTFEALGLKKRLLTTNADVVNYDFFNPNNIFIFDRAHPHISEDFLSGKYEEIPNQIYEKYYVENWVDELIAL